MATPHGAESAGEMLDAGLQDAVGVAMRACRARIALSKEKAARRAGVSTDLWSGLEAGQVEASLPLITRVALALELTFSGFVVEVEKYLIQGAPLASPRPRGSQEMPEPWARAQTRGERRMRIARAVSRARKRAEMTVEDLADSAGVEPLELSLVEAGVVDADHNVLASVGGALERSIWDLVDEAT